MRAHHAWWPDSSLAQSRYRLLCATRCLYSQPSLSGRAELYGGMAADPSEAADTLGDDVAHLDID